ncbi:MAG: R3H domain-containing nucleic acid-binding protein [Chloroflexota bacterium]
MRQVDIQARSVEEAVRLALEQLGRTRDQVKVEVLATDPGGDEVLVRVTTQDVAGAQPQEEVSPRGNRSQQPGGFTRRASADGSIRPDRDNTAARGERDGNRADYMERPPRGGGQRYDRPPRRDRMPVQERPPFVEGDTDEDDNRGNRIDEGAPSGGPGVVLDPSLMAGTEEAATPQDAVAPIAAEILLNILNGMKLRGRIVRRQPSEEGDAAFADDSDSLVLNVVGLNERDQSNLIGRRGETLDALQFLLNLILGRKVDLWARVVVDVEGYRLRRKLALINLARRTADQVQTRGQAIPLEAMPAYERRIIHMTLSEHPSVTTESSGAEPERRVVVLPKEAQ